MTRDQETITTDAKIEQPNQVETPKQGEESVDHKAALEAEKQKEHNRVNAQRRLEGKQTQSEVDIEAIVAQKVQEQISSVVEQTTKITQTRDLARKLSHTDDEYELVMYHLENSIRSTGDIETDVKRAHVLANEGRLQRVSEEAKRTVDAFSSRTASVGASRPAPQDPLASVEITEQDRRTAQLLGWDEETLKRKKAGLK